MSKYLPVSALQREAVMHQKRLHHGLNVGTHVRYPDAELGPFIIKQSLLGTLGKEGIDKALKAKFGYEVSKPKATK